MLKALSERRKLLVLGINSGTSVDSLDLAVAEIVRARGRISARFLKGSTRKFPISLHHELHKLIESNSTHLDGLVRLDNALGAFMGRAAAAFMKELRRSGRKIDLIASHGQTVRHTPKKERIGSGSFRGTLQIGSPQAIATATSLPVVADFRSADVALGNEGAPITIAAMWDLFHSDQESRLLVNIGGMSNYFYFPYGHDVQSALARDCGPGNSIVDLLVKKFTGKRYDRNGRIALGGEISERLLGFMLKHRYFVSSRKSTGREEFGYDFAEMIAVRGKRIGLSHEDIIATASQLTVEAVVRHLTKIVRRDHGVRKLYLTGVGRRNRFFVRNLSCRLGGVEVCPVDRLEIDGDYVEALAYAVMGEKAVRGIPSPTRFAGKKQLDFPVLGSIVQPPTRLSRK